MRTRVSSAYASRSGTECTTSDDPDAPSEEADRGRWRTRPEGVLRLVLGARVRPNLGRSQNGVHGAAHQGRVRGARGNLHVTL
jgi:hypothetical protein